VSASHDGRRRALLAIDTATTRVVVATGSLDGEVDGITTWAAGYRHGETLLATIGRFLGEQNIRRSRLAGIVVGTGPGAFTGLRVGIATAKGLAHGLRLPIVGVSTAEALLAGAPEGPGAPVLLLPAGPSDRILARPGGQPELLPGGSEPNLAPGEQLVAVDLDGRASVEAIERGEQARAGLGPALIRIGAERLRSGAVDDLAELVPEYVTLPRGVKGQGGEVTWSRDPR
jgi:tRNA threonylcarbamoyl adenosine modification protein YeaZ